MKLEGHLIIFMPLRNTTCWALVMLISKYQELWSGQEAEQYSTLKTSTSTNSVTATDQINYNHTAGSLNLKHSSCCVKGRLVCPRSLLKANVSSYSHRSSPTWFMCPDANAVFRVVVTSTMQSGHLSCLSVYHSISIYDSCATNEF